MICRRNGTLTSRQTRITLTAVNFSPTSIKRQVAERCHGRPIMGSADLQRYKGLLLEKQRELLSTQDDVGAQMPAAGGLGSSLVQRFVELRFHPSEPFCLAATIRLATECLRCEA